VLKYILRIFKLLVFLYKVGKVVGNLFNSSCNKSSAFILIFISKLSHIRLLHTFNVAVPLFMGVIKPNSFTLKIDSSLLDHINSS